jgi:hypothetical protein
VFRKAILQRRAENEGGGNQDPEVVAAEKDYATPQAARDPARQGCATLAVLDLWKVQ